MKQASITGTQSFQARLLEAEKWRLKLMMGSLGLMLVLWTLRRVLGGVVAGHTLLFVLTLTVILAGLVVLALGYVDTVRRIRTGGRLPWWRLAAGSVVDLGVPLGCLTLLHVFSPTGPVSALSAPVLLMLPLVILLSVLRLRPIYSVLQGLVCGLFHLWLVLDTFHRTDLDWHMLPMLGSYSVFLAMTGVAAGVLAYFVRRYIREAVDEAQAAEQAGRQLMMVEKELDIARDIQMGLLPQGTPKLAGFDIAGMARPADKAGGDYYDWQELPDGRLLVVIADVTGHGIGPALVMAVCRAYARATMPGVKNSEELLVRLNDLVSNDVTGGRFITMCVALVSSDGTVELLSAGHGPTFLYRKATGEIRQFGGTGLPLGVLSGEMYSPVTHLTLEQGDTLVLLTDGFVERGTHGGDMYGAERVEEVIRQHPALRAAELIRMIDESATTFAKGFKQADDMTAVVIKRI